MPTSGPCSISAAMKTLMESVSASPEVSREEMLLEYERVLRVDRFRWSLSSTPTNDFYMERCICSVRSNGGVALGSARTPMRAPAGTVR